MPQRPLNPWTGARPAATRRSSGPSRPATARWLALQSLLNFFQRGVFISRSLEDLFQQHRLDPRERRLATELASETVRRALSLDQVLSRYVVRPRESVEDDLWQLLRLGACQLLCLQHIPPHAAVHETVALCEALDKPRAKGFINGTLRSIEREIIRGASEGDARIPVDQLTIENLGPRFWPILVPHSGQQNVTMIEIARDVFADPKTDPVQSVADVSGLPGWLISRWQEQSAREDRNSNMNRILRWGLWFTTPGQVSLRVNRLRATREEVLNKLAEARVSASPGSLDEAIVLEGSASIVDLPGFQEGEFSVQDQSAMAATALLDPQPGESILDLCAAPGGKTCHIAERLQGSGSVTACDISAERLQTVSHNMARLQLENIRAFPLSREETQLPSGPFDAALVDVPCSNSGVLGKRPEARWRMTPSSFSELLTLQQNLLMRAVDHVRSGGRIVYSTCSIDQEENSGIVKAVLAQRENLRLVSETEHWPGEPADGGYQALLIKS